MRSIARVGLFAACLLLGCSEAHKPDGNSKPETKPEPAPPNPMLVEPEGEMPPLPEASAFAPEAAPRKHPDAPAPAEPPLLRWDFSAGKRYAYDFRQRAQSSQFVGNTREKMSQESETTGVILFQGRGGTATFVLSEFRSTVKPSAPPGGEAPAPVTQDLPPVGVQGVKEDGAMPSGGSLTEVLMQTMFPLPAKPLKVGERETRAGEAPFQLFDSLLIAQGTQETKLTRYVSINGRVCAELVTKIAIDRFDLPKELRAEVRGGLSGHSVFYFDVANRCFEEGAVALTMPLRAEARPPRLEFPNPEGEPAFRTPERVRTVSDLDTILTVKRNPAKEKEPEPEAKP